MNNLQDGTVLTSFTHTEVVTPYLTAILPSNKPQPLLNVSAVRGEVQTEWSLSQIYDSRIISDFSFSDFRSFAQTLMVDHL